MDRIRKGDPEATALLEDSLASLFDVHKSAVRVAEVLRVSPATLYRWTAPGGPAGALGDILRERGVMTRYDGRDAIKRPGRKKGFKVVKD